MLMREPNQLEIVSESWSSQFIMPLACGPWHLQCTQYNHDIVVAVLLPLASRISRDLHAVPNHEHRLMCLWHGIATE